jgi:asparagine synthase (glutamine-hydrolysing)
LSGFVGILNLDGAPVDRVLLERMTRSLVFRGPDAEGIWCEGAVGLGHTLLRTTPKAVSQIAPNAENEDQPAAFAGRLWIVTDARIDARPELIEKLKAKSSAASSVSLSTPDAMLVLHAYDAWSDACVEHLIGDFSFAIWDATKQRLFCARDQFGVKPFYYARFANTLIFSNTIDVLRLHPSVTSKLSDLAIGDFLLFGLNLQTAHSAFEDIKKLAAAHLLWATGHEIGVRHYWSFPIEEPLRYHRASDYVEEFRALLGAAVADRLRTDRVSVSMSGGLDSSTVAAAAAALLKGKGSLQAITLVHNEVIPDEERKYAGIVARHLKIPVHFLAVDDYKLFERCNSPGFNFPEPQSLELAAMSDDRHQRAASHGPVMLTGEGGDPGLVPSLSFYRGARIFRLLWDVTRYSLSHGRHPRLGFHLAWLRWRGMPTAEVPPFPEWLEPNFESRANLRERWREIMEDPSSAHPDRPKAHASVCQTHWSAYFEEHDAASTRVRLEVRHPLFDVRVLRFMLRLPTLPWCADKELLREAMHGDLPEEILRRPKAPLAGDPFIGLLRREDSDRLTEFAPAPELNNFIVCERIPSLARGHVPYAPSLHFRPLSLNYWLRTRQPLMYI